MSRWGEYDPAVLQRREAIRRQHKLHEAIKQAKLKNPQPLLDLIEPDDVRQAIDEAGLLSRRKKRGTQFTPVGLAVQRVRWMLERQRRDSGKPLPPGSWPALVKRMVTAMVADEDDSAIDFGPDANVEEISGRVLKALRKGKRRTKQAHLHRSI
jgi:hypothetical protein